MKKEITQDEKDKIWQQLKYYMKSQTRIKVTYDRVTVSGVPIKMNKIFCRSHVILDSSGITHKIFIEDIQPGTIFPNETKVEEHFVQQNNYYNRKSIPKSVRNQIWRDRFGDQFYGRCDVCKNTIRRDNFEAGHIISAKDGGEDTIDNLKPICRTCNRSMGTQNLEDFKREFHN